MMESKLEDILQSAHVDPSTASQLVADGWTLATFACSAVDIQDFDKSLDEMVPGQHLALLERSQLRAAFKMCSAQADLEESPSDDPMSAQAPAASSTSWRGVCTQVRPPGYSTAQETVPEELSFRDFG